MLGAAAAWIVRSAKDGGGHAAPAIVFASLLACGGCASSPHGGAAAAEDVDTDNDPAEPVNRAIFKANLAADHA